MCDMEGEGSCAIWEEHWFKARKPHECTGCNEAIPTGATYRKTATLFDGMWENFKHCARCVEMLAAIRAALRARGERDLFTTETLYMRCGLSWEYVMGKDPPPEVAALAFMLPKDGNASSDGKVGPS